MQEYSCMRFLCNEYLVETVNTLSLLWKYISGSLRQARWSPTLEGRHKLLSALAKESVGIFEGLVDFLTKITVVPVRFIISSYVRYRRFGNVIT